MLKTLRLTIALHVKIALGISLWENITSIKTYIEKKFRLPRSTFENVGKHTHLRRQ